MQHPDANIQVTLPILTARPNRIIFICTLNMQLRELKKLKKKLGICYTQSRKRFLKYILKQAAGYLPL